MFKRLLLMSALLSIAAVQYAQGFFYDPGLIPSPDQDVVSTDFPAVPRGSSASLGRGQILGGNSSSSLAGTSCPLAWCGLGSCSSPASITITGEVISPGQSLLPLESCPGAYSSRAGGTSFLNLNHNTNS